MPEKDQSTIIIHRGTAQARREMMTFSPPTLVKRCSNYPNPRFPCPPGYFDVLISKFTSIGQNYIGKENEVNEITIFCRRIRGHRSMTSYCSVLTVLQ